MIAQAPKVPRCGRSRWNSGSSVRKV